MTYVVVTLVVLFFLNIYCSGVSHKLFYQSKESSMIEKCLLASDEISTLEVLNSSTVRHRQSAGKSEGHPARGHRPQRCSAV